MEGGKLSQDTVKQKDIARELEGIEVSVVNDHVYLEKKA